MLARAQTFTIDGLRIRPVTVEVDIRPGLPAFTLVGLANTPIREARDRVRAAILNSGCEFPMRRITANLAPADVPKAGPGLDLALACAILAASGQLPREQLEGRAFFGELSLDGAIRSCAGTLAVAQACLEHGIRTLLLAPELAREASHVPALEVLAVSRLQKALEVLGGAPGERWPNSPRPAVARLDSHGHVADLADVKGQTHAVRAMVIAAAGAHNSLLTGPPGTGKTMLAERVPSILPPLNEVEAIEVTRIQSIAGLHTGGELLRTRPFRAPHHTITTAGMVGGARPGWIGEIVLAHLGVLVLDELSEFARPTIEALRQPLEDGRVAIVRAGHSALYPARFMLVGTTNPCPCGYAGEAERCGCSEADLARHRRRLSGPLLDRIDLVSYLARPAPGTHGDPGTSSAAARELVIEARARQARRLRDQSIDVNSQMDMSALSRHARLDSAGQRALSLAQERGLLSGRGTQRILRVARTIADLEGHDRLCSDDVSEALCLRLHGARSVGRAA